ncbi:LysR family transcriptional regulator [Roseibium litorale]|uniref:LysR family transcriptional regulator n=1 Tax=Roseibium litorale TaxID=2803841 RepID=A0ABR9CP55_9HYPH|nr:LysR family transcriptional regulator [Roseibium litorale]MBD8892657.1 LysR family transcriptional regulator [Roseibium litorale]
MTRLTTRSRLRHMQALVMLDDLRSMTRAAQAMGMTQPAMTQLVAELEQLLEVTLFLRHSRGVDPTPVAQELLPVARRVLVAMEEGAAAVATRMRRDSGPVRIAATIAGVGALLDRALPTLLRIHPNLRLQVESVVGQALHASFNEDESDIILCRRQRVVTEGWVFVECCPDAAVIVAGPGHPLAGKSSINAEELRRCVWLQNHVASIARHALDDLRERLGWDDIRETHVISRIPELIWAMLREGTMVALVPRSAVLPRLTDGNLVELPFDVNWPLEPVGFYWRADTATSSVRLLAKAFEALRQD